MGLLDNDQLLLGLSLMQAGAAKPVRTGFGEGLLGGLMNVEQMKAAREDRAAREEERKQRAAMQAMQAQQMQMQLEALKRQQATEQDKRNYLGALDPNAGPTIQPSLPAMMAKGFSMPEISALMPESKTPIKLGKDDRLLEPGTNKVLVDALPDPGKNSPLAQLITEMNALPPGHPMRKVYENAITKATTHQPATTLNVNTEKPMLNAVASGLGQQIDASLSNARAASQAIGTAQAIKGALDTGKVISGPGASFKIAGLQIGQTLGVGGKDAAEILNNTRTAIQSMAKAELEAAQQMKGQGQITEAERDIIRRAASGDINSLTSGEMRLLADSMEKTARSKISQHRKNVEALSKMPNAAPILPFYQVDEPAPYQGAPRVRRYNPATGALE